MASPANTRRSGVTSSKLNVAAIGHLFLSVVGAVFAAGLGAYFFHRLQLGSAERAEKDRVVDHARLLVLEIDEADGHVQNAILADGQQRLEFLAAHRVLELAAAGAEALRRAGCVH